MNTNVTTPAACAAGHLTTLVTRGSWWKRVCPTCLSDALKATASRDTTVNDFLARLEGEGEPPPMRSAEAKAAGELMTAAKELHDAADAPACRKVVKDVARVAGTTAKDVMGWPLAKLAGGLDRLKAELQQAA